MFVLKGIFGFPLLEGDRGGGQFNCALFPSKRLQCLQLKNNFFQIDLYCLE